MKASFRTWDFSRGSHPAVEKSGHFVIGAESAAFWGPLGVAIIFGLSIATFLTLVIVPTFYALLESWAQKIAAVARRVFAAKTEAGVAVEKSR